MTATDLESLLHRGLDGGAIGEIQLDGGQPLGLQPRDILRATGRGDDTEPFFLQTPGSMVADPAGTTGDEDKTGHNGFSMTRGNQYRLGLRPPKTVELANQSRSVNEGNDRWRKMAGMRTASTPSMLISMAGM